ncbi:hypothetical protein [Candidatus Leptofilum sp.]|uniref:hypothetical protein n=1 Tax=Candidatus Leptofilum sp. TaxID=3241576 RepID=UPI003B5A9876
MKRTVLWSGGVLILVVVLAAAAYTAVQLWQTQKQSVTSVEEPLIQSSGDGLTISLASRVIRAAELPERKADVVGIFVRRQDDAFVVGTGAVHMNVDMADPERPLIASHEGPEIEIVTNRDTILYRDDTITAGQSGSVPQIVRRVDSTEEIGELATISAWGTRRGDRLIAELLVYSLER